MKRTTSVILGLIVIVLGAVWGLNAVGITDIDIFFDGWWTLFIIVPCAAGVIMGGDRIGSLIGMAVGVALLMKCQGYFDFDTVCKLIVPVILVGIGLKLIWRGIRGNKPMCLPKGDTECKRHYAVFSGKELDYTNEAFDFAEYTAIFGGMDIDLRNAAIQNEAVINVYCVFGGADIMLPQNVNVKVKSGVLFGGVDEKNHRNSPENTLTVYVNATCIFGGIDIK